MVANIHWSESCPDEDIESKMNRIEDACKKVETYLVPLHKNGTKFGIVTAPEYYLGRNLTMCEHDIVLNWLVMLGASYPRILIIPGTMSWKEVIRSEDVPSLLRQLEEVSKNSAYASVPPFDLNTEKLKVKVGGHIIRNSAFVAYQSIRNMCEVFVYNKKTNFQKAPNNELYLPGFDDGSVLWCPNIRGQQPCFNIGLEICFDHATMQFQAAKNIAKDKNLFMLHPELRSQSQQRHIHIVLSNFVQIADTTDLTFLLNHENLLHSTTVFKYNDAIVLSKYSNAPTIKVQGNVEVISQVGIDVFELKV